MAPSAGNRSVVNAPRIGNNPTRRSTRVNRQAGESSFQCAATNSSTPAHSSTPPSPSANNTGHRKPSLERSDSSNARIRSAVFASTTPELIQRSSLLFRTSLIRDPPFIARHRLARAFQTSWPTTKRDCRLRNALLIRNQNARFCIVRRRHLVRKHVNVPTFRFAANHFKTTTDRFEVVIPRFGEVAKHLKSKTPARCKTGSSHDPEYVVVSHLFALCAKRYDHAGSGATAPVTVSQLSYFQTAVQFAHSFGLQAVRITWIFGLIRRATYPFGSSSRNKLSFQSPPRK